MKSIKKIIVLPILLFGLLLSAQETANRFFYELSFKPKKDSAKIDKVMTVLDITKDNSIFRDYTLIAQDSIIKIEAEAMQKSGVFKDLNKSVKWPKFSYKIKKTYPTMEVQYSERVANGFTPMFIGYTENEKFNWNIQNEKQKIGEYNAQKATTDFGGRQWIAWFSTDLPFQDGPYKFSGLPGLIVKIEDTDKNYSWELKGNKKVPNYEEATYLEKAMSGGVVGKVTEVSREKFEKTYNEYKKDPLGSARPYLTPEVMSKKMPGSETTIGDYIKDQEKRAKDFFGANDNPIEITSITKK